MSDELIEGRELRGRKPSAKRNSLPTPLPEEMPSGQYVALEPPEEAAESLRAQFESPTFHKGLKPIIVDDDEMQAAPPSSPPAKVRRQAPDPDDLPWSVIDGPDTESMTPPELSVVRVSSPEQPVVENNEPPPARSGIDVPHFHTPAGSLPVVTDDEKQDEELVLPKPARPEKSEFVPHFHTPTGTLPVVEDDESQDEALTLPKPARAEEPSYSRTPDGVLHPVKDEPPAAPVKSSTDDFLPHFHTPTGALPPVRDEDEFEDDADQPEDELPPETSYTPGILRRVPDDEEPDDDEAEEDEALPRSASASDQPSGEIVDAEWVMEVGQKLEQIQRQPEAPAKPSEPQFQPRPEAPPRPLKPASAVSGIRFPIWGWVAIPVVVILIGAAAFFSGWLGDPGSIGGPAIATATSASAGTKPALLEPTAPGATPLPAYAQGRIAYSSNQDGDFEIYVLDLAGGQISQVTDDPGADRSPEWSPDGKNILFVSDRAGDDDLYVVSASGGTPVRLTTGSGADRSPSWSPDGSTIVFSREDAEGSQLFNFPADCMKSEGACEDALVRLTSGGYDVFPAWSPEGAKLAYAASSFPGLPFSIVMVNGDGSDKSPIEGTGSSDFFPVWSPDGASLAFVSFAQGDYDLWTIPVGGGALVQMTQTEAADVEPAWSPDGRFLVFASDRGGSDFELYVIRTDCSAPDAGCEAEVVQLTDNIADDLNPAWSP